MNKKHKEYLKTAAWILGIIFGYYFIKSQLPAIQRFFATLGTKADAAADYAQNNPDKGSTYNIPAADNVRTVECRAIADFVYKEVNKFYQDESGIVRRLNQLANGQEATYCSTYYKKAHSETTLKSDLQDALHGDNFYPTGGRFKDLKDYIKQNIS